MEPIKKYRNVSYSVTLYPNRLDIQTSVLFLKRHEIIPIRNIASVDIPFGKRMEIKTNDGKKHVMNLISHDAKDLHDRIMELM